MMRQLRLLALIALCSAGANAGLIVTVTGDTVSGQTRWEFSGSYEVGDVISDDGFYSFNGVASRHRAINYFEHGFGDLDGEYVSMTNHDFRQTGFISSAATVTGSRSGNHTIDGLLLDDDFAWGMDDWAWYATGLFFDDETLTFSGSAVLGFDITTFGEGSTLITNPGDTFTVQSTSAIAPLTMSFTANSSDASLAPEPSTLGLLLLGSVGLFAGRRPRRRA